VLNILSRLDDFPVAVTHKARD